MGGNMGSDLRSAENWEELTPPHLKYFVDKLGERLTFEQFSTTLYEGLINKYRDSDQKERLPELVRMEQFHLEELKHYNILSEVISLIGGDPLIPTPAAEQIQIISTGWDQVMNDSKTTFLQALEVILQMELADSTGWEILIELAERNGLGEMAVEFQRALDEETFHLLTVKQWVQELTLNGEIMTPENH